MKNSLFRIISIIAVLLSASLAHGADSTKPRSAETKSKGATTKIDLNTANAEALQTLPGVGPATAREIIAARPFSSVNDLEKVSGIGPARMADIRDHVTVSRARANEKKSERATAKSKADTAPNSRTAQSERKATSTERDRERRDANNPGPSTAKNARSSSGKIDVNTADAATLETLPGVGPTIAQAIVSSRPFASVDDLSRVPGIGEARLAELRDHVTVSRRTTQREGSRADRPLSPTGRININTASREELEALPEIGPVKAQAIIDARPFKSAEDIMRVNGIKEATYEAIRDQITVR
jgi:competence protein ComEA